MSTATGWTHMNASLELPRKSTWYQMLKGDSNERCKQRTGVGCNRTSRETCRNKFKKEESKLFGRVAKESESERAYRSRKAGKRRHAIGKAGDWPREVHSLPAPSCITRSEEAAVIGGSFALFAKDGLPKC